MFFFESSKIGIAPIWKRHIKYRYIWILKHGTNLWEEVVNLPFWNGPCWHNFHPVTQRQLSGSAVSPINPNPNHLKLMFFRFVDQTMMKIKFYGNDENQVSSVGNDEHQVSYGLDQLFWKVQVSILFKFIGQYGLIKHWAVLWKVHHVHGSVDTALDFWRRSVFWANWALLSGIDDNLRQLRLRPDCYHQGVINHQKWLGNAHLYGHFNGNIICKWEISIAMFDYRRVSGKIAETHHAEPSSSAFGEIIDKSLTWITGAIIDTLLQIIVNLQKWLA